MSTAHIHTVVRPSDQIVAREIEGELIIVPLTAGFGDMEDELYTFNQTGRAVWRLLDGQRDLAEVIALLTDQFEAAPAEIEADVIGLVGELVDRRILVEDPRG